MSVEMRDVLSGRGRRFCLIVVPLIAAAAALAVMLTQPPQYTAVAEVTIPPDSAGSGSEAALYVANFQQKAGSAEVMTPVADEVGISVSELLGALEFERVEQSSTLQVKAATDDDETSAIAAVAGARASVASLAQDAVVEARRAADTADARSEQIQDALDVQTERPASDDGEAGVTAQELTVADLERQVEAAEASGADAPEPLSTSLADALQRLEVLRDSTQSPEALQAGLAASQAQRVDTQRELIQVQTALDETEVENFVQLASVTKLSPVPQAVQAAALAAILAVGLLVLFLFGLETRRQKKRQKKSDVGAETPATASETKLTATPSSEDL